MPNVTILTTCTNKNCKYCGGSGKIKVTNPTNDNIIYLDCFSPTDKELDKLAMNASSIAYENSDNQQWFNQRGYVKAWIDGYKSAPQSQLSDPVDGWISVGERLPEKENYYLACLTYGQGRKEVVTSFFRKDLNCFDSFHENIITHWMPLPEPPRKR